MKPQNTVREKALDIQPMLIAIVAFAISALLMLILVRAADGSTSVEGEVAQLTGPAEKCEDYIVFSGSCDGEGGLFPADHAAAVAQIKASTTRATKVDTLTTLGTEFGTTINGSVQLDNNPARLTPSIDLVRDDYIIGQGPTDANRARGGAGVAHIQCQFSHFSYDDPIAFPGQPGAAHLHMYFGNTEANAFSTPDTILNQGNSTCQHFELNRTAYWMPALLDGEDHALTPSYIQVYYERYGGMDRNKLEPFPEGLRFITGDASATSPQPVNGFSGLRFFCGWYEQARQPGGGSRGEFSSTIPNCDKNTYSHLQVDLDAPYCWNGENEWSAENPNVTFPTGSYFAGNCPASHPTMLPALKYRVVFKLDSSPTPTNTWYLSSDIDPSTGEIKTQPGITLHADWYGGWHRPTLNQLIDDCLRPADMWCHPSHMGNGDIVSYLAREATYDDVRYAPEDLVKMCPLRNGYDGNKAHIAYCKAHSHE